MSGRWSSSISTSRMLEYGYRMDGPFDPGQRAALRKTKILLDPYARVIGGRDAWGVQPDWTDAYHHRGRLAFDDFDWEHDRPLETPIEDLVIYEAHVRSFTRASVVRRAASGHLRGHPRQDPLPQRARRQLPRTDADLRVRRVREQPPEPGDGQDALQLLGLQHRRLLRAESGLRRERPVRDAGGRAEDPRQGAARARHRGHPRCRLQPHRRGQRARADDLLPGHRQPDLLHADAGRATTSTSAAPATR